MKVIIKNVILGKTSNSIFLEVDKYQYGIKLSNIYGIVAFQIWLYAYNLTNEAFSTLSKHMIKLVQWNNCRTHLLSNVVTQKCGLFNHYMYGNAACNMVSW
jgi:hypothetical protein